MKRVSDTAAAEKAPRNKVMKGKYLVMVETFDVKV